MIEEITFYYPNGKKETFEIGREVEGEIIKAIELEYNRSFAKVISLLKSHSKVLIGVPFSYKTTEPEFYYERD
jgi:hypothetical protein